MSNKNFTLGELIDDLSLGEPNKDYRNILSSTLNATLINLYGEHEDFNKLIFTKINSEEDGCCELCYSRTASYEIDLNDEYIIINETIDEKEDGSQTFNIVIS